VRMQRDVLGSTFGDQRGADRHSPNLSAITSTGGRDMQRRWVRRGPFGLRTVDLGGWGIERYGLGYA
jgi:hypothetical protein